jgi:hypothetical protein
MPGCELWPTDAVRLWRYRCKLESENKRVMPDARKVARYSVDILLILVPLAVVLYFVAFPDRFDAVLDWFFRHPH